MNERIQNLKQYIVVENRDGIRRSGFIPPFFSGKADEFPVKPVENGQNHKKNNN